MKKITFLLFALLFSIFCFSQNEKIIYGNLEYNVFLHFKSPIQTGIVGNDNFVFIFDKNNDSKIGVLKIINPKSKPTNILITTKDGLIYSYLLKYNDVINKFNYFIETKEALNYVKKEDPIKIVNKKSIIKQDSISDQKLNDTIYQISSLKNIKNLYLYDKKKYFKKQCQNTISDKPYYFKSIVSRNGINFKLLNIRYDKNELYFYYEIKNKRFIDLDIDYMVFEISSKSLKKRSSSQSIELKPLYIYKSPIVVKGNATIRFVAVFNKFTVSKNKVFLTQIKEKNGERDIFISVPSKQLNNPN